LEQIVSFTGFSYDSVSANDVISTEPLKVELAMDKLKRGGRSPIIKLFDIITRVKKLQKAVFFEDHHYMGPR
jgi:hypothetical protein